MMISKLVSLTCGTDINYSPCQRKLSSAGQCVRFLQATESSPTISKILLVVSKIGIIMGLLSPLVGGALAIKATLLMAPPLAVTVISICVIACVVLKIMKAQRVWGNQLEQEWSMQKQERGLVDALGGQQAYEALPKLVSITEVFDDIRTHGIQGNPDGFKFNFNQVEPPFRRIIPAVSSEQDLNNFFNGMKPQHVGFKPITADTDYLHRPFIAVCVKDKRMGNNTNRIPHIFVETLFIDRNWNKGGPDANGVFKQRQNFGADENTFKENLAILKQLRQGTHPDFELVTDVTNN